MTAQNDAPTGIEFAGGSPNTHMTLLVGWVPPSVEFLANGPEDFCRERMAVRLNEGPLPEYHEVMVVEKVNDNKYEEGWLRLACDEPHVLDAIVMAFKELRRARDKGYDADHDEAHHSISGLAELIEWRCRKLQNVAFDDVMGGVADEKEEQLVREVAGLGLAALVLLIRQIEASKMPNEGTVREIENKGAGLGPALVRVYEEIDAMPKGTD